MTSVRLLRAPPRPDFAIRCCAEDLLESGASASIAIFYEVDLDVERLADALVAILPDFPHFHTRPAVVGGELHLVPGPGVSFTVRDSPRTFAEELAAFDAPGRRHLVTYVDPALDSPDPLFTVRVTRFAGGGTALGISWHHVIGDWSTLVMLLRAWSRCAAGGDYVRPTVVTDRVAWSEEVFGAAPEGPTTLRRLDDAEVAAAERAVRVRKRLVSLWFAPEELEALRASMQAEASRRLTINDAVVAHVACRVAEIDPRPRTLAVAVNARSRVGVPQAVAGNYASTVNLHLAPGDSPAAVADRLRGAIQAYAGQHLDFLSNARFVAAHGGVSGLDRLASEAVDPLGGSLLVSNWTGVGVSRVDFGVAAPLYSPGLGLVPVPWVAGIQEGPRGVGYVFTAVLPLRVALRLGTPEARARLHPFGRPPAEWPWLW